MDESSKKQCKYGEMIDLRGMEEETLVEMREWGRQRLEEKLRAKAAAFSPADPKELRKVQHRELKLKTAVGEIATPAVYGLDRESGE